MLIDGGATHNFIDCTLVERRGLPTEEFEGLTVVVAGGGHMECTRWIPKLNITLGNYSLTDDFFIGRCARYQCGIGGLVVVLDW